MSVPDFQKEHNPISLEDHIEFLWSHMDDFEKNNLLPNSLIPLIGKWRADGASPWWGSDFE
ncbi:MAG: hypothetical protein COU90_04200 [Candidatus Ryanbacteria bacterium CG10_big_fil_rev_8_21_14_0_10_43_42]|uniref:Uncharacterized protein n=1 Tax=Candidatus Ryanbacteria bacterium CG10_big_fil_rev_8_21_14_0_10_43_42 TaxID=1974864 RepID=A0A2M8KVV3_9BACT|nr:MAG: hypothetical protein COU90_04200 [Candidatus Ryanbacteria bacterium CG10_big_fil_rev_8_21_14_0_10_43_42]